ncbi:MAG: hypothetical protein RIR76_2611 [Verrucomicrobiota bacterium]|jgi:hypothetical protein
MLVSLRPTRPLLALFALSVPGFAASLTNLSVRTTLESSQVLTVGFTAQGGSKGLLVRAAGPGLRALGVQDAMPDPSLAVFRETNRIDGNDNWGGGAALVNAFGAAGAFPFASAASADAALLMSADGGRTVQVSGPARGNVLVEVYDTTPSSPARLTNLSALNRVGTGGDILIAGITLSGSGRLPLLVRAVGPSLAALGVPDTLRDPRLVVLDSAGAQVAENDTYDSGLASTFASVGAFPLVGGSLDAALVLSLPAGGYTIQVSGADGGTGSAIIEVYEVAADVWSRNGWTRPASAVAVATAATAAFARYVSTVRTPDLPLAFEIQPGADAVWSEWIPKGVTLVARAFSYPTFATPYTAVAGVDREWFVATFTRLHGAQNGQFQGTVWDSGNPAWADSPTVTTNSWNLDAIRRTNQLQNNPAGMAQTPGHEFFHIVQRYLSGRVTSTGPGPVMPGMIPQWFWEGPAMFVGHQTANHLGFSSYLNRSRQTMVDRANSGFSSTLRLEQISSNVPPNYDPYGLGHIATEFIVAQVGMDRFVEIYREVAKGRVFDAAFGAATGVPLADFLQMFEEARPVLGVPRRN